MHARALVLNAPGDDNDDKMMVLRQNHLHILMVLKAYSSNGFIYKRDTYILNIIRSLIIFIYVVNVQALGGY